MNPERRYGGNPYLTESQSGEDLQKPEILAKIGLTTESLPVATKQMLPNNLRIGLVFIEGYTHEDQLLWLRQFGSVYLILPGEFREDLDLLVIASDAAPPPHQSIENYPYTSFSTGLYQVALTNMVKQYASRICPVLGTGNGGGTIVGCSGSVKFELCAGHDKLHPVTVTEKWQEYLGLDDSKFHVKCDHALAPISRGEGFVQVSHWKGVTESFFHHDLPIAGVMSNAWEVQHVPGSAILEIYGYALGDAVSNSLIHYLINLKSSR